MQMKMNTCTHTMHHNSQAFTKLYVYIQIHSSLNLLEVNFCVFHTKDPPLLNSPSIGSFHFLNFFSFHFRFTQYNILRSTLTSQQSILQYQFILFTTILTQQVIP